MEISVRNVIGLLIVAFAITPGVALGHGAMRASWIDEQELQVVPGSQVRMAVPDGFSPASSFAGFQNAETGALLMVVEIPGPFDQVSAGLSNTSQLKRQGIKVLNREERAHGDYDGALHHFSQKDVDKGIDVHQWLWVFGDEQKTVMVKGICPTRRIDEDANLMRAAVLSSVWDPEGLAISLEDLPFTVKEIGNLKFAATISKTVCFTSTGELDAKVSFKCGPIASPYGDDREAFVKQVVKSNPLHVKVSSGYPMAITIDDLSGFSCSIDARHRETDEEIYIYRVVLFDGPTAWSMVGTGPLAERRDIARLFKKACKSFERRRETLRAEVGGAQIVVPATWSIREGLNEEADLQAGSPSSDSYLVVLSEAKDDLVEKSLIEFSAGRREWFEDDADEKGEVVEFEIGELSALRCEYTMRVDGTPIKYVHVSVEGKDTFHQLLVWSNAAFYENSKQDMERVISSFREQRP